MTVWEWIRFSLGALLVCFGIFLMITGVIGNFRFRYVLSRMHAAGLGDTLGLLSLFSGLSVLSGSLNVILKLAVILLLFWTASPVASHMIMKMEIRNGSTADGKEQKS